MAARQERKSRSLQRAFFNPQELERKLGFFLVPNGVQKNIHKYMCNISGHFGLTVIRKILPRSRCFFQWTGGAPPLSTVEDNPWVPPSPSDTVGASFSKHRDEWQRNFLVIDTEVRCR